MQPPGTQLFAICALVCSFGVTRAQQPAYPSVLTCDKLSLARPGFGVSYNGVVRNSDYRFSTTIPGGLVGWGAGPTAPFHGFMIYLGSGESSCINFEIHIRVELPEDSQVTNKPKKRTKVERVKVGNRWGLQTVETGIEHGTEFENVTVTIQLRRAGYYNDAAITLVTPTNEAANAKTVLARFLSAFRFFDHD